MKKNILIISAIIIGLSLTAFSLINKNTIGTEALETTESKNIAKNTTEIKKTKLPVFTEFTYDVSPRFKAIKKTDIDKATTINDFIDAEIIDNIVDLESVNIIVIKNEGLSETREMGYDKQLTTAQIELLRSLDYASGFTIRAEFTKYDKETGKLEHSFSGPHYSIVPEKQAVYAYGNEMLVSYLKANTKAIVTESHVITENTRPVKFHFTVTKNGTVDHVRLDRSTNYPAIDNKIIELIKNTGNNWISAENSKGEKVDQRLVLSLGIMGLGC